MAAGLGFKDFTTGEVLTAADVDGYLMQGVWVFASAAARDAAVTSPQEGNFAYLKDTNVTTYYTGSAWANLDTTGMTNPMTTTGDTIYSSPGSTPVRLGIGTTGQVLTVAGGVPSWATPAAGGGSGLTFITRNTFTDVASVNIDSIFNSNYFLYLVIFEKVSASASGDDIQLQLRYGSSTTATGYQGASFIYPFTGSTTTSYQTGTTNQFTLASGGDATFPFTAALTFNKVGNTSEVPMFYGTGFMGNAAETSLIAGQTTSQQNYTGILIKSASSNVTGTVSVYGYAKA